MCHKSYIVNIDKVQSITKTGISTYDIEIRDLNKNICVSRNKYKEVLEILKRL